MFGCMCNVLNLGLYTYVYKKTYIHFIHVNMNVYMYMLIYISICMQQIWEVYMQTYSLVKIYQKITLGDSKWI